MDPLTVPGTLDSLETIREYVTAAATAASLDRRASYRLRLAVDEIATNIITHGYAEAGLKGMLDLQADIDEKVLTISIEDTGVAYDPQQSEPPDDLDLPLEQRQVQIIRGLTLSGVVGHTSILDGHRQGFLVNLSPQAHYPFEPRFGITVRNDISGYLVHRQAEAIGGFFTQARRSGRRLHISCDGPQRIQGSGYG